MSKARHKLDDGSYIVKRPQSPRWYVEWMKGGVQIRKSLKTESEAEARKIAPAVRAKADAGPDPTPQPAPPPPPKGGLTLGEAILKYAEDYRASNHADSSAERTLPVIEAFGKFVGAEVETKAITKDHILGFINRKPGRSYWTVRNDAIRIKAFLRWVSVEHKDAVDLWHVNAVVLKKIKKSAASKVAKPIPDESTRNMVLQRLEGHPWLRDFVVVLFETGMRPGELLAIRGEDVEGQIVDIRPWGEWAPKTASGIRTIPVTKQAAKILKGLKDRAFDTGRPLFCDELGKMRKVKQVSKLYRERLRDEDRKIDPRFKVANLYSWRHIFCSLHAKPKYGAFMELPALAEYIGHAAGSEQTLGRWYNARDAEAQGAPGSLIHKTKTKVTKIG